MITKINTSPDNTIRIGNDAATQTQFLHDAAQQYTTDNYYRQHGVLQNWNLDTTTVPAAHIAPSQEDVGLAILSNGHEPEASPRGETPRQRGLWSRLGRTAHEGTQNPEDTQAVTTEMVAAAAIDALSTPAELTQERPSFLQRVTGLIGSAKIKIGLARIGANGNFLDRHPNATVAAGVVAAAGMVLGAYFKLRGVEISGQSQAADFIQPAGSAGSSIGVDPAEAGGPVGSALPSETGRPSRGDSPYLPVDNNDNPYVPRGEDTDSGADKKYVPREMPDSGDVTGEAGANVVRTERLTGAGDTISHHAEQLLIDKGTPNPKWDEIRAETQRILTLNGMTWEDARRMDIGAEFKV